MPEIIYRDNDIAVCLKPVGVGSEFPGMPELLMHELSVKEVFCVHRLDTAVAGLMVYALNKKSAASLSSQIADRRFRKEYLAIAAGRPETDEGTFEDLLFRDRAKNKSYVVRRKRAGVKDAKLDYRVLDCRGGMSLIKILLHTGRSHQIRVQFSSRGMPLLGDVKYGSQTKDCNIALWSYSLGFVHPRTKKPLSFSALPENAYPWDCFAETFNNINLED